jgi:uncharacterized Zn-finger protein
VRATSANSTPKHWKKSISRSYTGQENQENGTAAGTWPPIGTLRHLPPVAPSRPLTKPRIVQPWNTPPSVSLNRRALSDPSNLPSQPLRVPPLSIPDVLRAPKPWPSAAQPAVLPIPYSLPVMPHQLLQRPTPIKLQQGEQSHQLIVPPQQGIKVNNISTSSQPSGAHDESSKVAVISYSCKQCKKSFNSESGYFKHQQLHTNNQIQKDFSCQHCLKTYNSQSALKMHIRTHTLPCKCTECGKSFSRPWLLQGHMRTHSGEKPFACSHCSRTFADKSNLRAHLQTHLQNKKYSCPGCQRSFSRMGLLNKHTDSGCQGGLNQDDASAMSVIQLRS